MKAIVCNAMQLFCVFGVLMIFGGSTSYAVEAQTPGQPASCQIAPEVDLRAEDFMRTEIMSVAQDSKNCAMAVNVTSRDLAGHTRLAMAHPLNNIMLYAQVATEIMRGVPLPTAIYRGVLSTGSQAWAKETTMCVTHDGILIYTPKGMYLIQNDVGTQELSMTEASLYVRGGTQGMRSFSWRIAAATGTFIFVLGFITIFIMAKQRALRQRLQNDDY